MNANIKILVKELAAKENLTPEAIEKLTTIYKISYADIRKIIADEAKRTQKEIVKEEKKKRKMIKKYGRVLVSDNTSELDQRKKNLLKTIALYL